MKCKRVSEDIEGFYELIFLQRSGFAVQCKKRGKTGITNSFIPYQCISLIIFICFRAERAVLRIISNTKGQALTEYLLAAGVVLLACAGLSGFLQVLIENFLEYVINIFLIPIIP